MQARAFLSFALNIVVPMRVARYWLDRISVADVYLLQHEDAARNQSSTGAPAQQALLAAGRGRTMSLANVRESLESTNGPSAYTVRRGKAAKAEKQRVHVMINVQAFMCPVGEPAEVREQLQRIYR